MKGFEHFFNHPTLNSGEQQFIPTKIVRNLATIVFASTKIEGTSLSPTKDLTNFSTVARFDFPNSLVFQ